MSEDDQKQAVARIHAVWMLLRPHIEAKAQELGASPLEMSLALTIGTPAYVYAAAVPEMREASLRAAANLFTETCASLARGEH